MRRIWIGRSALVAAVVLTAPGPVPASAGAPAPSPGRIAPAGAAPAPDAPAAVPVADRTRVLGAGWNRSADRAWTVSGDGDGLHVLVADAATGYAWRSAATLSEPGFDTDRWIGNACATASGRKVVVTYAPRAFTNKAGLFDRGGFTAVVDLTSGAVRKLPVSGSLAYFSPGCGTGETALLSQFSKAGTTRLVPVDAAAGKLRTPVEVRGELTSAIPTRDGIVAADRGGLVRVAGDGSRTAVAGASGVPFALSADGAGGVVFLERRGDTATVRRAQLGRAGGPARSQVLGSGPLADVGLTRTPAGRVFITGAVRLAGGLPATVERLAAPKDATVSSAGDAVLTSVTAGPGSAEDPTVLARPVRVEMTIRRTGQRVTLTAPPGGPVDPAGRQARPALGGAPARARAGSPSQPIEAERTCSVPRNDPRNQAMQPKPRQVEWAVDQAVTGVLNVQRPQGWKNLGMPAYTPQGLFPPIPLLGGGRVPAQVFLGVIAQESNMWQAPGSVVPGVTGNPLVGNYYGLQIYNDAPGDDWTIDWAKADCGYGVTQLTDGMRLAGHARDGEVLLPYAQQRAVALDYAANVAAGLRVLQDKWNQTRSAGLVVNNGDASKIENWFYAVWAYNSGFHPQADAARHAGAWGVGWLNNPANPKYPANRSAFLDVTYADAATPQRWPYPEKVMGWAGHPVEVLESPGTLVPGFRSAWWNGDKNTGPLNRSRVKPPVAQFCDATNNCDYGAPFIVPDVVGEPAGPCAHRDAAGKYDLKCWYHGPSTWKKDCSWSCGNETLRFDPGYAEQTDGTAYPPNCDLDGLPDGALIVDDQPAGTPVVRPGCAPYFVNRGTFGFDFGSDAAGKYPSKTDLHQLGAGFGGHFSYAHTRHPSLRGNSMRVTGTWTLDRGVTGWARVFVHMPDHGAHTQQAAYEVDLGNGVRTRMLLQRTLANTWVSLGAFPFAGTPKVRLSSTTHDGDGAPGYDPDRGIQNEDIAFDAVAFQLLPGKPRNIVVSLGDSYSSGEGGSEGLPAAYYRESDNNGASPDARNACHRSPHTWSRRATLVDADGTIGERSDGWSNSLEHHLIACAGAETEGLLPYHSVASGQRPVNAWNDDGKAGMFGEVSQLDKGFLDEHTTLVTLSVGGNDARFGKILARCVEPLTVCQDTALDDDTEPLRLSQPRLVTDKVRPSIVTVLREIRKKAPNARVVLMGYPLLFDEQAVMCGLLSQSEVAWLNETGVLLNTEMAAAVAAVGGAADRFWFSDPRSLFIGRTVCGNPQLVHGMIAPWNKTPGEIPGTDPPVSQQSYHPTIAGYGVYATVFNTTLRTMGL